MKKRNGNTHHANAHSHSKHTTTTQSSQSQKNTSDFAHLTKSFFEIFTEKDKKQAQIYNDIKCLDGNEEYKP